MNPRALSFGAAAATYERFRPGYPDELVDQVLSYAGGSVRTALEIGAGTGKATRAFAARGIAVTATDPDPQMLAELRLHVPAAVTTIEAALEDLEPDPVHDLVYAAAALHWTDPDQRWSRIAGLLAPGGCFACLDGETDLAEPGLAATVLAIHTRFVPDIEITPPDGTPWDSAMRWPGSELERSDLFNDVRQIWIDREWLLSAEDYIGHLSTISAYLQLSEPDRNTAFTQIREVIPDQVRLRSDIVLHLARLS